MMFEERHEFLCLHGGAESFSLLHLSDLHLKWSDALLVRLEAAIATARPDLVLMTGDYFDVPAGARLLRAFLARVARQTPVVFITGNHDHWYGPRVTALLHGIEHCHCIDGTTHALRSPRGFAYQFHSWGQARLARRHPGGCTHVALVHDPERIQTGEALGALDLVLAGHLHGGQFVCFTAPDSRHYPGSWLYRHCADRLALGDTGTTLIVSRGLGDLLPLRYRCPREIVHIHIT